MGGQLHRSQHPFSSVRERHLPLPRPLLARQGLGRAASRSSRLIIATGASAATAAMRQPSNCTTGTSPPSTGPGSSDAPFQMRQEEAMSQQIIEARCRYRDLRVRRHQAVFDQRDQGRVRDPVRASARPSWSLGSNGWSAKIRWKLTARPRSVLMHHDGKDQPRKRVDPLPFVPWGRTLSGFMLADQPQGPVLARQISSVSVSLNAPRAVVSMEPAALR